MKIPVMLEVVRASEQERLGLSSSNLPPGRAPYVLVVLTRRIRSEAVARALILDVSRLVWQHSTESAGTAR